MVQIRQSMDLRQRQNLVMTTQLRQSIELLQLPVQELSAFVAQELEQNPFLQEGSPVEENGTDHIQAPTSEHPENQTVTEFISQPEAMGSSEAGSYSDTHYSWIQSLADRPPDLRAHVLQQIHIDAPTPQVELLAAQLSDQLDANGYLPEHCLENTAMQMGASIEDMQDALSLLQRCDPAGVGARDLQECLTLQLMEKQLLTPSMQCLLDNLPLVAKADYAGLAKRCGVEKSAIPALCQQLQQLNPKPGTHFTHEPMREAVPDVIVRKNGSEWQVELNQDMLPKVLVNNEYHATVSAKTRDKEEKQFFTDRLSHANWLVRALEQRAHTILKVATEIVARQRGFLESGISAMRPLTLKEIADTIGMHESTISRVTNGKFMATPRGTVELKHFFNTAIGSSYGDAVHSSPQVKHRIKALIDTEKPDAILTDDNIATLLRAEGINAARRTVAKYRESMGIPGSVIRKRQKRQG